MILKTVKKISIGFVALSLGYAHGYESSLTLPKGVSRMRNVSILTTTVKDTFNNNGNLVSVANPMTQSVAGSTIIDSKLASMEADDPERPTFQQLKVLTQALNNADPNGELGDFFQVNVKGNTEIRAQKYFFGYEYGISDSLSVGLSLPVVSYDIKASAEAKLETNSEALLALAKVQNAQSVETAVSRIEESASEIENAVLRAAFDDKGYQRPADTSYTALGEMEFGIKKAWVRNKRHGWSTQATFRAPTTTRSRDYSNLVDPGAGDGQWDMYLVTAYDFYPTSNIRLGTGAKYTIQFPDSEYMPVRRNGEEGLADLNDDYVWDNVNRNLGDYLDAEVSTHFSFWKKRLKTSALYILYYKGADSIYGGKNLDYASISADTEQYSHSYELGFTFSTVEDVVQQRLSVPLSLRVAFNDTFAGKNSLDARFYRLDFAVYFR